MDRWLVESMLHKTRPTHPPTTTYPQTHHHSPTSSQMPSLEAKTKETVDELRANWESGVTLPYKWRIG